MDNWLEYFKQQTSQLLQQLETLVRYESPTNDKAAVDVLGAYLHTQLEAMGAKITLYPRDVVGDIRLAKWGDDTAAPILILCHIDTVWPVGTINTMPIKITEHQFFGPGALDMKAGIVITLAAIQALQEYNALSRPIWLLLTTDEEVSSHYSRAIIEELAQKAALVLVMEPAGEYEALKTMRKGHARYTIRTEGLAAHAGIAPESGINAIVESAHQILYLNNLNDLPKGISVSVTQIQAGVASNVIPPLSELVADVRFASMEHFNEIDRAIHDIIPTVLGAKISIEGGLLRPPMERDQRILNAFKQAKSIAEQMGMNIGETFTGGISDGNLTAPFAPTLDGLGPEGAGQHAAHEHVLIRSIPRRAALLTAILQNWQDATP
ncbi:MAG: carboxypeptidase [Phototrophicales bacterium]|nr:MAG: carboxypeptidase [Phototrophicales bacterium]